MNTVTNLKNNHPCIQLLFCFIALLVTFSVAPIAAQNTNFQTLSNLSGRQDIFDSASLDPPTSRLVSLCDSLGATTPFRVVGVDLYPLSFYQDPEEGFRKARDAYHEGVKSQAGGYLAFFVTYGERAASQISLEFRLPEGAGFDSYSSLDEDGIDGALSDTLRVLINETSVDGALVNTLSYAYRILSGEISLHLDLTKAGFVEMQNNTAIFTDLTEGPSAHTNPDLIAEHVYDYSQLRMNGNPLGEYARQASSSSISLSPRTYMTSNVSAESLSVMGEVSDLFSDEAVKMSLWVHVQYQEDGSYKVFGRSAANFTQEEAEAIVNAYYAQYMSEYATTDGDGGIVAARQNEQMEEAKQLIERCPDPQYCNPFSAAYQHVWGDGLQFGKNISTYCCFVDGEPDEINSNFLTARENYRKGIAYGFIDGMVGTMAALKMLSEGLQTFKENQIFSIEWIKDLYDKGKGTGAWLEVTGQKFKDSLIFAYDMAKTIATLITSIGQIVSMIGTAIKNFISDLNPFTGFLRTGYSVGIIAFEIVMEVITGGTAGLASLGTKLASLSKFALRNAFDPWKFVTKIDNLKVKLWSRVDGTLELTQEMLARRSLFVSRTKNCFVAGTLVAMSSLTVDAKPIENVELFDLVLTEDVTSLGGENELKNQYHAGLVTIDQIISDRVVPKISDVWYKAHFTSKNSETQLEIARPASWFIGSEFQKEGDIALVDIPHMGINEKMLLKELRNLSSSEMETLKLTGDVQPVTSLIQHNAPLVLQLITVEGDTIGVTPEHPFYDDLNGEWLDAGDVLPGDILQTLEGVSIVLKLDTLYRAAHTVYNLETRKNHNYFVGRSKLLVHNAYSFEGTRAFKKKLDDGTYNALSPHEKALKRLSRDELDQFFRELYISKGVNEGRIRLVRAWETSHLANDIPNWGELVTNIGFNVHLYDPILSRIVSQGNGPICFGFRERLLEFSIGTNSVSFLDFPAVFGSSSNFMNLNVFEDVFQEVTRICVNGDYKIHFNLDNIIDNPTNLAAINNGLVPINSSNLTTLWEVGTIMRNIDLYSNTIFYRKGKVVKLPELHRAGIKPVK
jgi:hypothetical protein